MIAASIEFGAKRALRVQVEPSSILAGKKILVVDDDAIFAAGVRAVLESLASSVEVFEVGDGVAALEVLDAQDIDLVVSDLRMPRMDGVELLSEILNRALDVPVVMLSGRRDAVDTTRANELGVLSFLDKPVDYDELIDAVERALQPRPRAVMRGFSLAGLLQLVNLDRKSTTVSVRSGETVGRIFVSEGEVVDAWLGNDFGKAAFFEIMGLQTPLLELAPLPAQVQRCITDPLNQLLLDAFGAEETEPSGPAPEDDHDWGELGKGLSFDVAVSGSADGPRPRRSDCS